MLYYFPSPLWHGHPVSLCFRGALFLPPLSLPCTHRHRKGEMIPWFQASAAQPRCCTASCRPVLKFREAGVSQIFSTDKKTQTCCLLSSILEDAGNLTLQPLSQEPKAKL